MDGRFERVEGPPEATEERRPYNAEAEGLRGALRLLRVSLFREEVARHAAEREAATLRLERSRLLLAMAEETSRTGQEFFGPYANNFSAWLDRYAITEKETTDETDDA